MPIVTEVPGVDQPAMKPLERPRATRPDTAMMDERRDAIEGLSSYVGGSAVLVDEYFKQYLLDRDRPRDFDDQADGVVQQYEVIKNLVIKETTQSAPKQSTDTGVFTGSRTAIVHAGLRPYVGDVMLIKTLGSRSVMYRVSRVERLSIIESSSYQIEFEYMQVLEPESDTAKLLRRKTVITYMFDGNRESNDLNPYVSLPTSESLISMSESLDGVICTYVDEFLDKRSATMLYHSGDTTRIYDPALVEFFLDQVTPEDHVRIKEICHYGGEQWHQKNGRNTIYSVLSKRSWPLLKGCRNAMKIVPNAGGYGLPKVLIYQDIDNVATAVKGLPGDYAGSYAVTPEVYNGSPEGLMGGLIICHIKRVEQSLPDVMKAIESSYDWSTKDRYYLVPVLIAIINAQMQEAS